MEQVLVGKVSIVTGAAGGIGRVYARALAQAGSSVVVADLNGEAAARVATELSADGLAALGVAVDITSPESVQSLVQRTRERFGGVDVLVNNAALMAEVPQAPLTELPLDWWERVLRVNLTGAYLCIRAVVPSMSERGGGKIINQSSGGAFTGGGVYGVSKLALVGLTVSLARELGPRRINVNAIAPGIVETEAGLRASPKGSPWREQMRQVVALRPYGEPQDLVGALLYLASPASDWMTGQTLNVDGGWIMRL
jgi:NAD(P)-dependent dehydrogenase (short-subunit alcohol dehydrogenase family)